MKKIILCLVLFLYFDTFYISAKNNFRIFKYENRAYNFYRINDYDKYFSSILNIIKSYPDSPISKFYLITLRIDKYLFKDYDKFINLKFKLLNRYKKELFLYNILLNSLMEYYISKNEFKKAEEVLHKTPSLTKWRYTMPFRKTFYNDFDIDFNDIEKNFNIAKWHIFNSKSDWGWVPLSDIIYPEKGVVYASCNIYIKKNITLLLWLTTSASAKLFINNQKIFSYNKEIDDSSNILYKIDLKKGWNNILLKLFSEKGNWNFKFRFFYNNQPFTNYQVSLDNKNFIKYKVRATKYIPKLIKELKKFIYKNNKKSIDYYRYSLLNFIFFNSRFSIDLLLKSKIINDKFTFLNDFLLGRIYFYLANSNNNTTQFDMSSYYFKKVLKKEKNFARAKEFLIKYYLVKDRIDSAYELIMKLPEYNIKNILKGDYFDKIKWDWMKINSYEKDSKYIDALISTSDFYKKYSYSKSNSILTNLIQLNLNKKAIVKYIMNLYEMNDKEKFLKYLNIFHRISPYNNYYYYKLADYYIKNNQPSKALKILKSKYYLLRKPETLIKIGDIFYKQGITDKARYYYKKALKINPVNNELMIKLDYLRKKKLYTTLENKYFKNASFKSKKIISEAFSDNNTYDAPIKYYLDELILKVNKDGTYSRYNHIIFKILNIDGKNDYGEVIIKNYSKLYYYRVRNYVNKNTFYEPTSIKKYNGNYYFSLPKLKIGSVVDVVYQYNKSDAMFENTKYFYYYPFLFQSSEAPIDNAIFRVIVPKDYNFKYIVRNEEKIKFYEDEVNQVKIYEWRKEESKKINLINISVPIYDIVPNIYISSIPGWDIFFNWYWGKIKNKMRPDWNVQKFVYKIYQKSQFNKKFDSLKFIKDLYYYIQNNFSYEDNYLYYPEDINITFFNKVANSEKKSIFFKSILDKFNFKSYFVLLRDKTFSKMNLNIAVPYYFTDILVYIPSQFNIKKDIYIDFSNKFMPFGFINGNFNNVKVFVFSSTNYKISDLKYKNESAIVEHFNITDISNNRIILNGKIEFQGDKNLYKREFVDIYNRENVTEGYIKYLITGISLNSFNIFNINQLEKNLIIKFKGKLKLNQNSDILLEKLNLGKRYIYAKKIEYNVMLYNELHKKIIINIKNIKGKIKLKKTKKIFNSKFGKYIFKVTNNSIRREIYIPTQRISIDEYNKFLDFCRKIDTFEDKF